VKKEYKKRGGFCLEQPTLKEKWYINRKNFLFYLNFIKNKIKTD